MDLPSDTSWPALIQSFACLGIGLVFGFFVGAIFMAMSDDSRDPLEQKVMRER